MELYGKNLIGNAASSQGDVTFQAVDPTTHEDLTPLFHEATEVEVERALKLAEQAFYAYRQQTPGKKAALLSYIAANIEGLGDELIERAVTETGLGRERLRGEQTRTTNQLKMFASLVEEGSWVDARIDRAVPNRKPLPKPDLRRMLIPIGPVVVFGASNFPLAFSVAGGDTASALAAGCPVVVKAHPAHPGTSELVAKAILDAVRETGMPDGVFSLLHGTSHGVGLSLVRHPLTKAVGYTGSLKAGRALFEAAAARPEPIPVYAEMGSINPVFILPKAAEEHAEAVAEGLQQSVTLGTGQFCTNPGLIVILEDEATQRLVAKTAELIKETPPGTMLYAGINQAYTEGIQRFEKVSGVHVVGRSKAPADPSKTEASAVVFTTDTATFLKNKALSEELFGPSTLVVTSHAKEELLEVAKGLAGHLTATLFGEEEELEGYKDLISVLENKVGRLIFNGFPTGVEVCASMHHGGPYPATTDVRSTSVGTAAIYRFTRPIAYQNLPHDALPPELRDGNPRSILRLVDGDYTRSSDAAQPTPDDLGL